MLKLCLRVLVERLVRLYDYYEATFQDFAAHDDAVTTARFSRDGRRLLSGAAAELLVWDVNV